MRRFFVKPSDMNQNEIWLKGAEFHHLHKVSRLEVGERVELLSGDGRVALAEIKSKTKKEALLEVIEIKELQKPPLPQIEIVLCLPKFQTFDSILQKCVELGVTELTPVVSDRSFIKKISKEVTQKQERWEKIVDEACKQSGRAWPMKVNPVKNLKEMINQTSSSAGLFLYEGEARPLKDVLGQSPIDKLSVFIGAEGGFSPSEVNLFEQKGYQPASLGSLVLRVETACTSIVSVIQYHFGRIL